MTVAHIVTGYDKRTERLMVEHPIPDSMFRDVRALAEIPDSDAEAVGSYPLSPVAVFGIASRLSCPMNVETYDWFLEPAASE